MTTDDSSNRHLKGHSYFLKGGYIHTNSTQQPHAGTIISSLQNTHVTTTESYILGMQITSKTS
jgi:hypothetical protein